MDLSVKGKTIARCECRKSQYSCGMTASSMHWEFMSHDIMSWGCPGQITERSGFSRGPWGAGDKAAALTSPWEDEQAEGALEKEAAEGLPRQQEESSGERKVGKLTHELCMAAWLSTTCKEQPAEGRHTHSPNAQM